MIKNNLVLVGEKALKASKNHISNELKVKVLKKFEDLIRTNKKKILIENMKDINFAKKKKLKENMIRRLELNNKKIEGMMLSIRTIASLKDPVNYTESSWKVPNGLKIQRVTVPIGVIGIIYESRPNVTSDVSSLCFKSGNCVILKGGSEAYFSNKIISQLFRKSLNFYKIDKNFVQFVESKDRGVVKFMLSKMRKYIDVIIPRGGKNLVKMVKNYSNVPVIGHLEGVCHTYIDKNADLNMSKEIVFNAKMRNTSICGATETLLIHEKVLKKFINPILDKLKKNGCKIFADSKTRKYYLQDISKIKNNDWGKEYLSSKISVKAVKNISDAIKHINKYGTMHTDAIITKDKKAAHFFLRGVKSSIAIHNSSTQFADGGEFGFGGEVGISTNKLPPRGPVGLQQLVSYKYEVLGSGQVRE